MDIPNWKDLGSINHFHNQLLKSEKFQQATLQSYFQTNKQTNKQTDEQQNKNSCSNKQQQLMLLFADFAPLFFLGILCISSQTRSTCCQCSKKVVKWNVLSVLRSEYNNSSFIFGWMKWSIMKEMINGFTNSQVRWQSEKVLLLEICVKCEKCVNVRPSI